MAISLTPTPTATAPETAPITITPETASVRLPEEIAKARAEKASYGLGKPIDEIYQAVQGNLEEQLRLTYANEIDGKRAQAFNTLLEEYSSQTGGITPKQIDHLRVTLKSLENPTSVYSVFEEYYSKGAFGELEKAGDPALGSALTRARQQAPAEVQAILAAGDTALAKSQVARTIMENWHTKYQNQGIANTAGNIGKELLTMGLYGITTPRGQVQGSGFFEGVAAQKERLDKLPVKEYANELKRITDYLGDTDPGMAYHFAKSMVGTSTKDQEFDAALTAVTLGTLPGVGAILGKVGRLFGKTAAKDTAEVAGAVKDVLKAADSPSADAASITAAAGDLAEAAVKKTVQNAKEAADGSNSAPLQRAVESMDTFVRTDVADLKANPGVLSKHFVNRIEQAYTSFKEGLYDTIGDLARVDRLNILNLTPEAVREIKDSIAGRYSSKYTVLDVGDIRHDTGTNTYWTKLRLGDKTMGQWTERETAENYANHHGFKDFKIEQQGLGYHIVFEQPLRETDSVVRKFIVPTKDSREPSSALGQFVHWLRTPDDTLSPENMINRKIATYTPSHVLKHFKEDAKYIHDLAKGVVRSDPVTGQPLAKPVRLSYFGQTRSQRMEEWTRMVNATSDIPDPSTGKPGIWYKDPAEIDQWYRTNLGRSPDAVEIEAYFAFKRMMEGDRFMRNLAVYRNMTRLGVEEHMIVTYDKAGSKVMSAPINGVRLNHLPRGDDSIAIVGKTADKTEVLALGSLYKNERRYKQIVRDIESGKLQVFKIFAPEHRPLDGFGKIGADDRPRYVLAPSIESKPLPFEQVPRRGGPHIEYDYPFYVKQANMRWDKATGKWIYEGDTTVMPAKLRAMGQDAANHLDHVRLLLREKKEIEAQVYATKNLPIAWKEVQGWFRESFSPDGKKLPPFLNLDEKIMLVPENKMIIQTEHGNTMRNSYQSLDGANTFRDGTVAGSDNMQNIVPFTQQRDVRELFTLNNKGSRHNPLWEYVHAEKVDPIETLNNGLTKMVNSLFLDDYKMTSVEQWLKSAIPYMKESPAEIWSAPYHHFYHPEYITAGDNLALSQLKADRWKIEQFIGRKGPVSGYIDSTIEKFGDWVYGWAGQRPANFSIETLGALQDAPSFIRGAMFHLALGLFSPVQLLVQSQSLVTIAGVAGWKHASSGTAATALTWWSRINKNPNIIKSLDEKLSNMHIPGTSRWKRGEFEESLKMMDSTGFGNVGAEHALLSHAFNPKVVESGGKKFLDAGSVFFSTAERNIRFAAWHTAYREYRDTVKSVGKLTTKDRDAILAKADLLNTNMSSASNSIMQHGVMSIPTQFFTYQIRLMEQFWGKRLGGTTAERNKVRARMMAWYAGMYGLPMAGGITGFPAADQFRKAATDNGYVVGDNWFTTALMEGLPALMGGMITGGGDIQKGKVYNVGDRLGVQGLSFSTQLFRDGDWFEMIGGAAGSKIGDFGRSLSPFWDWAAQMWRNPEAAYSL